MSTSPLPPKIPTGQELYDSLMGHIEPELTTEGLKTLDTSYTGETPEQNEERKKRYVLAFEQYTQAYEGYVLTLASQVERYRKSSFDQVELQDRGREEGFLERLTQTIYQQAA